MLPVVLVVDDDERARRLVRMGLELEGLAVIEAESLRRARSVINRNVAGVVLDRQLPDGDGLELLGVIGATCPDATIVVHSTLTDAKEPSWVTRVDKGDLPAIVAALDLRATGADLDDPQLAIVDLVRSEAEAVAAHWEELCRWDPLLPPDAAPPLARRVVEAVAEALERPQPLGWGPDPALARVTEMFAATVGSIDVAVAELICLREAFQRHVTGHVPPAEEAESRARVNMIIDRAIWSASRITAARMERQLPFDRSTGLGNRSAFTAHLARELARATRYERPLSVVLVALRSVGAAGDDEADAPARVAAGALASDVREPDGVFRTGPTSFAVVAPETGPAGAAALVTRLRGLGLPEATFSTASFPEDATEPDALVAAAERRLTATSV